MIAVAAIGLFLLVRWVFRERTPQEKLAAYKKEISAEGGEIFETNLRGKPVAFLLQACKVYLLDTSGKKVTRQKVVETGFYLWFTGCMGQSIYARDGYVYAKLSNRAFGAGGGNASGGLYRSQDGVHWEKEMNKGWLPVEEAQP